jgi:hypothetical protein
MKELLAIGGLGALAYYLAQKASAGAGNRIVDAATAGVQMVPTASDGTPVRIATDLQIQRMPGMVCHPGAGCHSEETHDAERRYEQMNRLMAHDRSLDPWNQDFNDWVRGIRTQSMIAAELAGLPARRRIRRAVR